MLSFMDGSSKPSVSLMHYIPIHRFDKPVLHLGALCRIDGFKFYVMIRIIYKIIWLISNWIIVLRHGLCPFMSPVCFLLLGPSEMTN